MKTRLTILLLFIWNLSFGQNSIRIAKTDTITEIGNTIIISPDVVYDLYESEIDTWIKDIELSNTTIAKTNNLVIMLKDSLNIDYLNEFFHRIWILGTETSEAALIDIVNGNTLTAINSPSFIPFEGFTLTSAGSKYLNTNFIPSASANIDSFYFGVFSRTDAAINGFNCDFGARNLGSVTVLIYLEIYRNTPVTAGICFGGTASTVSYGTDNTSLGLFGINKDEDTVSIVRNNSIVESITAVTTSLPEFPIFVGCRNNAGTPESFVSSRQYSFIIIGKIPFTNEIARKIINCLEYYMDSNDKGVLAYRLNDTSIYWNNQFVYLNNH